jgi:hypothetical protein
MRPKQIKMLQSLSRDLTVMPLSSTRLVVESRSDNLHNHIVEVQFLPDDVVYARCTCEWSRYQGVACVHVMAALDYPANRKGRRLNFWLTEDDALRQKPRTFYLAHPDRPDAGVWITSRDS